MSETRSDTRGGARVSVTACGLTDMGMVRKNNEDAFLVANIDDAAGAAAPTARVTFNAGEHAVLLAVSDGMGGADAGEVASALVVESLRRAMAEATSGGADWNEATKNAVQRANREVWTAARAPGRRGMGATVTAVCVHGDTAHIAEVGDSRAYLLRNARIRQVTRDQSFVQYLVDAGALKPEEAASYPMKNVVLQAMGQNPDVQVALGRLALRRGDKLLLCSDGLSGKVKAEEMLAMVQQSPSLESACKKLIDAANARGGDDNITVVLAQLDGEGLEVPRDQETLTQTFQVVAEYKAAAAGLGLDDDDPRDDDEDDDLPPPALKPIARAEPTPAPKPAPKPAKPAAPADGAAVSRIATLVLVGIAVAALLYVLFQR